MQRPVPWFWLIALALLLVAPGLTARLFVDVIEGVTLLLVLGPLVLAGAGGGWFRGCSRGWHAGRAGGAGCRHRRPGPGGQ